VGRRPGVQGIQYRLVGRRTEEQRSEHRLADAVDLSLRNMVPDADAGPDAQPSVAKGGVRQLQRDGRHIAAGEHVAGRRGEDLGGVAPLAHGLNERPDGGTVGGERIRG
jgi:hypothetical protein